MSSKYGDGVNDAIARSDLLTALHQPQEWDVIVIGGGATGLGAAVEAVTRGYRTLLLERLDFGKGTSSRSTKLVHGGVRYLAQGNVQLVREALRERGRLRRNAPHLVHDRVFVVPGYVWWAPLYYGMGLKLYDWLSGRLSFGASRFLNAQETRHYLPTLNPTGLRGGVLYHDGQFDDARLAIALLRTVLDHGGVALNYAPVTELVKENNRVVGVVGCDQETGEQFTVRGKVVINATGVFVDAVRRMDDPAADSLLSPSQGAHLVVDQRFLSSPNAMMIPKTDDGRVLFAVPWHGRVVLGTTDTPIDEPVDEPRPLDAEIEFILRTAAQYLSPAPTRSDVLSVFVGLRPLVKASSAESTSALSREHVIRRSASGLLTITGGKWTTYRQMGEDVVDAAIAHRGLPPHPSVSATLKLHGWTATPTKAPLDVYGSDADRVQTLPGADRLLHSCLPYVEAEVRWAARFELARTVEDVLARRTRALLLNAVASIDAAPRVAELLADELGRDRNWQQQQVSHYCKLANGYTLNSR